MSTINKSILFSAMPDIALRRTSEENVSDVLNALSAGVLRYRVTINLDDELLTYRCGTAGECGGLREAFEKVHGGHCNAVIWDELQNRRIY